MSEFSNWQWILGSGVASVVLASYLFSLVKNIVFTRLEGEKLENRLEAHEGKMSNRLDRIEDKIDRISQLGCPMGFKKSDQK